VEGRVGDKVESYGGFEVDLFGSTGPETMGKITCGAVRKIFIEGPGNRSCNCVPSYNIQIGKQEMYKERSSQA
jgi:hypothetical protein